LKFCSKCGTILVADLESRSLVCPRCKTREPMEANIVYSNNKPLKERVVFVGEKERNLSTMPQVNVECPKCGNLHAYCWMVQTRSLDESATQFFRCTKCGHTWREYS